MRRRSGPELWLLLEATLAVAAIKPALRLFPLQRVRATLAGLPRTRGGDRDRATPQRVAWAVKRASTLVPGNYTCLVRALAAQLLLERRGFPTDLQIGFVKKGSHGSLEGHAWLGCGGRVVIGDDLDLTQFTSLAALPQSADGDSQGPRPHSTCGGT